MGLLSHTWIGCLLAFFPGPPRAKFNNAYFSLYPVDKINKFCPKVEPGRDIGFYYFSRKYPEKPIELRIGDDFALSSSGLNLSLPTVIYFPPFFDGFDSTNMRDIREAYLERGGYNFVAVVHDRLNAGPWYPTAVSNTFVVGRYTAFFVDYLLLRGLPLKNLHFIGFSIGAHAAGIAGRYMSFGRPSRITGLDPASPLFLNKHMDMRLDKSDADLVVVIHTDRVFGISFPIGHVDFFVDFDLYPQPGCKIRELVGESKGLLYTVFCSHLRSNKLYATSVLYPTGFPGYKCFSWKNFLSGDCSPHIVEFMGPNVSPNAKGIYYVPTKSAPMEIGNEIT